MKERILLVLGLCLLCSGLVVAQTKVVTNADLEKYRKKRLAAEKDLRENYAEMGFDSPEEIARQNEKSQKELIELSLRLRQQRIERENREREIYYYQNSNQTDNSNNNSGFIDYGRYYGTGYYNTYRTRRYRRSHGNRRFKPGRDYRQRFINSLPNYVLRNHRFTRIETRRNQRTNRGITINRRRNR